MNHSEQYLLLNYISMERFYIRSGNDWLVFMSRADTETKALEILINEEFDWDYDEYKESDLYLIWSEEIEEWKNKHLNN
jgi:hypothetical protein